MKALGSSAETGGATSRGSEGLECGGDDLAVREARHRAIFESLAEGVIVQDPSGRIVDCNASAERLLGLSRGELLGRTSLGPRLSAIRADGTAWSAEDHPSMVALMTGEPQTGSVMGVQRSDGSWIWLSVQCRLVRAQEGASPEGVVTSFSDVTAMQRVNERLLEVQKLESVTRLAGGIAHDFNNLLTAILCYAELGAQKVEPESALAEYLQKIVVCGDQAAKLTQQLLAFARRKPAVPRELDLCELLSASLDHVRKWVGDGTSVRMECAAGIWPVLADRAQMQHVLFHLASNARDALKGGGSLELSVANFVVREHDELEPGDYVELRVRDDGAGMPPEVLTHAFEPFFTTKEVGNGSGLGLATCYGIVRQHRGSIAVQSEPGRGTTVVIRLPKAPVDADPMRAASE